VTAAVILKAAKMATDRAENLHAILRDSLAQLELDVVAERNIRLEKVRARREKSFDTDGYGRGGKMDIAEESTGSGTETGTGAGGIARDDPMLAWASLHQAAGLRETE
jgi:hypothetical protein